MSPAVLFGKRVELTDPHRSTPQPEATVQLNILSMLRLTRSPVTTEKIEPVSAPPTSVSVVAVGRAVGGADRQMPRVMDRPKFSTHLVARYLEWKRSGISMSGEPYTSAYLAFASSGSCSLR